MKKNRIVVFMMLCVLLLGITGCASDSQEDTQKIEEITQEEKYNFITDFLIEFFTFNGNGRYDTLMEAVENEDSLVDVNDPSEGIQPISESQQKAIDNYYADLSKYVTEDCLNKMQANRLPVQLDQLVKERGLQESIDYFVLDGISGQENTYLYEVYFEGEGEEAAFIEKLQGQVTVEIIGEEIRISSISITQ